MLFLLDLDLEHVQHFIEFLKWGRQFFCYLILKILLSSILVAVVSPLNALVFFL
jgi:hypothetical protein